MNGNRALSGIGGLVAGAALCLTTMVGASSAFAEPPECPRLNHPPGSGSAPTFNTLWMVRQIDSPLGSEADSRYHLCDGDRFVFIRTGPRGSEKEYLIPVGDLAVRWQSGQLEVKRTPETAETDGNRLCVEAMLKGHKDAAASLHVFKFQRTVAWGPDIDRVRMEIEYDEKKASFNCESESKDTHHGMAHAED